MTKMTRIPTCPNCRRQNTFVLQRDCRIECLTELGGCGHQLPAADWQRCYPEQIQKRDSGAVNQYLQKWDMPQE